MLVAIAHIVGTVVALAAFGLFLIWIGQWESERNKKRVLQEVATKLGLPLSALEQEVHQPEFLRVVSERYSNELLRNRLSDLCGVLRTLWGWIGALIQYGIVGYTLWSLFAEGPEMGPFAWFAVGTAVFFWLVSVIFSFACYVLTGRYPGEARASRKALAQHSN